MKYFTFIVFLLSSLVLNAQLNMEEISYVPSPSGYYDNLIVKGNVKINELVASPFNIQSYGSFLNMEVSPTSNTYISNLNISTGTVALFSEFSISEINELHMTEALKNRTPTRTDTTTTSYLPIKMNGGNLSVSKSLAYNADLVIGAFSFETSSGKNPVFNVKTNTLNYNLSYPFRAKNVYIMGMKVPACEHGYYWQPIRVASTTYTILACNMTSCSEPWKEETCLNKNTNGRDRYQWNTPEHPCRCYDTTTANVVTIL